MGASKIAVLAVYGAHRCSGHSAAAGKEHKQLSYSILGGQIQSPQVTPVSNMQSPELHLSKPVSSQPQMLPWFKYSVSCYSLLATPVSTWHAKRNLGSRCMQPLFLRLHSHSNFLACSALTVRPAIQPACLDLPRVEHEPVLCKRLHNVHELVQCSPGGIFADVAMAESGGQEIIFGRRFAADGWAPNNSFGPPNLAELWRMPICPSTGGLVHA